LPHLEHELAIAANTVEHVVARQRMTPARLGEAPQQHFVARVEKHDLEAMSRAAQLLERLLPRGERLALARLDRDRQLVPITLVREVIHHLRHERHGDVVDARELDVPSARSAVLFPAPDNPVTMTICIYSTASAPSESAIARCNLSRNARAE